MKTLIRVFNKVMCKNCWGMKVIELQNGNTIECPACKGKGFTE